MIIQQRPIQIFTIINGDRVITPFCSASTRLYSCVQYRLHSSATHYSIVKLYLLLFHRIPTIAVRMWKNDGRSYYSSEVEVYLPLKVL